MNKEIVYLSLILVCILVIFYNLAVYLYNKNKATFQDLTSGRYAMYFGNGVPVYLSSDTLNVYDSSNGVLNIPGPPNDPMEPFTIQKLTSGARGITKVNPEQNSNTEDHDPGTYRLQGVVYLPRDTTVNCRGCIFGNTGVFYINGNVIGSFKSMDCYQYGGKLITTGFKKGVNVITLDLTTTKRGASNFICIFSTSDYGIDPFTNWEVIIFTTNALWTWKQM